VDQGWREAYSLTCMISACCACDEKQVDTPEYSNSELNNMCLARTDRGSESECLLSSEPPTKKTCIENENKERSLTGPDMPGAVASNPCIKQQDLVARCAGSDTRQDGRSAATLPIQHLDMALLFGGPRCRPHVERMVRLSPLPTPLTAASGFMRKEGDRSRRGRGQLIPE
jgi:hypothetical protein